MILLTKEKEIEIMDGPKFVIGGNVGTKVKGKWEWGGGDLFHNHYKNGGGNKTVH